MRTALTLTMPNAELLELDGSYRSSVPLATLWQDLISGRSVIVGSRCNAERCFLELESSAKPAPNIPPQRLQILQRILTGSTQKVVADDLKLAVSTIAAACSYSLQRMGQQRLPSRAPLLLMLAAHAARGVHLPDARKTPTPAPNRWELSVERPDRKLSQQLTNAERAVLGLVLEGQTHAQIARARGVSTRTVANQLALVFKKFGACGRGALVARLVRDGSRPASA